MSPRSSHPVRSPHCAHLLSSHHVRSPHRGPLLMPDRWAFVPCALNLTQSLVVDLPQLLGPYVVARTKPVVGTGESVVACAIHSHSSGACLPAPCTVTRVVRGYLRHARSLEWCTVTCTVHVHSSWARLPATCTVTALGTPLVQDFAQPVGAWSLGLACSTGCALTWSPLLCGRRWLADKTKPPELGAWFEVRSLV